jgi:hypothetical protein
MAPMRWPRCDGRDAMGGDAMAAFQDRTLPAFRVSSWKASAFSPFMVKRSKRLAFHDRTERVHTMLLKRQNWFAFHGETPPAIGVRQSNATGNRHSMVKRQT